MDYTNKVVVLTGAGGGIGSAMAEKFAALGAKLALLDICEQTKLAARLDKAQVLCAAVDVSDEASVTAAVQRVLGHYGRIDVLINAAGIPGPSARAEDYPLADAKKVFAVNVFGTFLMMQKVLPIMQAQRRGAILNFGSVSGIVGYTFEIAYGASKAAIIHMSKNAASENGGNGVRINCISPGWVKTNMMDTIVESYKDAGIKGSSEELTLGTYGRPADPSEIAAVAAFLCSDEAAYMNGSNVLVDGGMTLG